MSQSFFGRQAELRVLNDHQRDAAAGTPQLVVLSGHRRVGKTFLLLHWLQAQPGRWVYFQATRQAQRVELDRFAERLRPALGDDPLLSGGGVFRDWEQALATVVSRARLAPLTVVIDEAPYLTGSTPGFASIVQAVWDAAVSHPTPAKLLLVLTGSAAGVMGNMVGPQGPLRGRHARHLRLDPFDLPTVNAVLGLQPAASVQAYAATGGWPLHVAQWDTASPAWGNLERMAGQTGGVLLEDADVLLRELPGGPGIGRVLGAIGRGRTRKNEIVTEADQRVDYPLEFLVDSGLVNREIPVGAGKSARPEYHIADAYLRFWFEVLYADRALIEGGQGRAVLAARRSQWQRHVGWVFEEAARQHAQRLVNVGDLPSDLRVGRWWTTHGRSVEVDVLGLRGGRTALIGEAKWASGTFEPRWIRRLRDLVGIVPDAVDDPLLCVWSRSSAPATLPDSVRWFGVEDIVAGPADQAG